MAILGILAAAVIPQFGVAAPDQATAAAQIITSDLDYARTLAIANGTSYEIEFKVAQDCYILTHAGTNPNFDTLPDHPQRKPGDDATQLIVELAEFPQVGTNVTLVSVHTDQASPSRVLTIEFDSLGQTDQLHATVLWLKAAGRSGSIYLPVRIHPVTGIATIGDFTQTAPTTF